MRMFAIALSALAAFAANAQTYPDKPIRLVVPSPPVGSNDLIARLVGQQLSARLGQQIVVDNRAGADGIVGAEFVARAPADGYTLLLGNATVNMANAYLHKRLPYDPVGDFTPIAGGFESITCLALAGATPFRSVADLIDAAKRSPGKLTYGSSGSGGAYSIMGEVFKAVTRTDLTHVPYKGLAPAMTALLAGQIDATVTSVTVALPHHQSGKIRILALLDERRYRGLNDVPTLREAVSDHDAFIIWNGFFGPAGMPPAIVRRLNAEIVRAMDAPEIREKLDAAEPIRLSPDEFATYVKARSEAFARIVALVGIKPQ